MRIVSVIKSVHKLGNKTFGIVNMKELEMFQQKLVFCVKSAIFKFENTCWYLSLPLRRNIDKKMHLKLAIKLCRRV